MKAVLLARTLYIQLTGVASAMQAGGQVQAGSGRKRRCAEVCLELLLLETVRTVTDRMSGPAVGVTLEAIGFRVGAQLAER